ncbi:hypothetical protein [Sphingobium sp.]|uniref:hypothetical protein n=1 Tax=Sphingobium sp. TaxID=1912891 RepID=UPI00262B2917|nr:hypothetical protein [Sphingobium sp.]
MMTCCLSACAETTSVYHNRAIDTATPRAITMDAYQRSVFFNKFGENDLRICAEAAPDAFSALSASLAAEADVVKKSGSLAAALSQSGATIERTQTINMLRESMYRTCERYLSGGISRETLIVQAARDQRNMVDILAIEQLTRTARLPSVIIAGGATSASVPNRALIDMVTGFKTERDTATKARDAAKAAFDAADGSGKCSSVATQPADDSGTPTKTAWDACKAQQSTLAEREDDLKTAQTRLDQALALGGNAAGEGAVSAATQVGQQSNGAGGTALSDTAISAIASAVRDIANKPGIDEAMMFCIAYVGTKPDKVPAVVAATLDPDIKKLCIDTIAKRAAQDEQIRAEEYRLQSGGADISIRDYHNADQVAAQNRSILLRYLTAADAKERQRRLALVGREVVGMGYSAAPQDIFDLVTMGNVALTTNLLRAVRIAEQNPAGQAALANPSN